MIVLTIVIPVYNEGETLSALYERLNKVIPDLKKGLESKGVDGDDRTRGQGRRGADPRAAAHGSL